MSATIEAIFDGEVLRPQTHVDLKLNGHYWITIGEEASDNRANGASRSPSASTEDQESEAWNLYNRKFKAILEPEHNGQTIAIDLDSEDYEVADRTSKAWRPLKARRPNANLVMIKIGPVSECDLLGFRGTTTLKA